MTIADPFGNRLTFTEPISRYASSGPERGEKGATDTAPAVAIYSGSFVDCQVIIRQVPFWFS
jgi:hypothetical protein